MRILNRNKRCIKRRQRYQNDSAWRNYILKRNKKWYLQNKEKVLEAQKKYLCMHRKETNANSKLWTLRNPERRKLITQRYRTKHIKKRRAYNRRYYYSHRKQQLRAQRLRRANNVCYKLKCNLRCALWYILFRRSAKKYKSAVRHLGCSIEELKTYIESKWQPGMNWTNYGLHGWHIDHIRPLSSFDVTKKSEQTRAIHYTNLQPLWAIDNLHKSGKYSGK
jgi:hypothetical protein